MGTGGKRSYGHEVPVGRIPGGEIPRRRKRIISYLIYNKEAPSSCTPPYTQGGNF